MGCLLGFFRIRQEQKQRNSHPKLISQHPKQSAVEGQSVCTDCLQQLYLMGLTFLLATCLYFLGLYFILSLIFLFITFYLLNISFIWYIYINTNNTHTYILKFSK